MQRKKQTITQKKILSRDGVGGLSEKDCCSATELLYAEPSSLAELHAHHPALDISMKLIQEKRGYFDFQHNN